MSALPKVITDAIESLSCLPGIGTRSAERLVFSLLKNKDGLDQRISRSLSGLRENVRECRECCHLCEGELCGICENLGRNKKVLCIVETPMDLLALERTHEFKGVYHVLHGVMSPLDRIEADDLRIGELMRRIKRDTDTFEEIIFAVSGTTESEATALYIAGEIKKIWNGKMSRLARGIPSGGDLDYLDAGTLCRAISERREL